MSSIKINEQFKSTIDALENTKDNIFITGKAGTGKSTLLQHWRKTTNKKHVVLAPTGVAALNVNGVTIHSFFGFMPNVTIDKIRKRKIKESLKKIIDNLDLIIIDEISMVRADMLDYIDIFLRKHGPKTAEPFGGIQMIFIGDLYQLPPVVNNMEKAMFQKNDDEMFARYESPYFFSSNVFSSLNIKVIELDQIYRQEDPIFIDILNSIRNNSITDKELSVLNQRYSEDVIPDLDDFYICLTTTNAKADSINEIQLKKIDEEEILLFGNLDGNFKDKNLPTSLNLSIKIGAQVMMLNNDQLGRWVNGSIGKVIDMSIDDDGNELVGVSLNDGSIVNVAAHKWEMFQYTFNEGTSSLDSKVIGKFRQHPMKLAWAVTIHKSQGKTFDNVILDLGYGTFAHGQLYVALSRCTSIEGLHLCQDIEKRHVIMDTRINNFLMNSSH